MPRNAVRIIDASGVYALIPTRLRQRVPRNEHEHDPLGLQHGVQGQRERDLRRGQPFERLLERQSSSCGTGDRAESRQLDFAWVLQVLAPMSPLLIDG
jgi:hypothetical protein